MGLSLPHGGSGAGGAQEPVGFPSPSPALRPDLPCGERIRPCFWRRVYATDRRVGNGPNRYMEVVAHEVCCLAILSAGTSCLAMR